MFGSLFKRPAAKGQWPQAMAAMGRSAPRLEQELDTFTTGEAGILVRPSVDQDGQAAEAELQRALGTSEFLRAGNYRIHLDSGGFPWIVVAAGSLLELTSAVQAAGSALIRTGIGERVIASVFPFTWQERRLYWVYQPRVSGFTPFVPLGEAHDEERDHPLEVRMASALHKSIPVVKSVTEWYPVWDRPF